MASRKLESSTTIYTATAGSRAGVIPKVGADTAEEVFSSVGSALSWWEAAEDTRLGLFRLIVSDSKRIKQFVGSLSFKRSELMSQALRQRPSPLTADELDKVEGALSRLDALRTRRNQI